MRPGAITDISLARPIHDRGDRVAGEVAIESAPAGSELRITSILDKAVQHMDAIDLLNYSYHSCYFNGDEVKIELIASADSDANRVEIKSISAGEIAPETDTICGDLDECTDLSE